MAATKEDIRGWLQEGKKRGATHVVIAVDTWDHEDFPSYVMPNESVQDRVYRYENKSDCRLMEVYNLSLDIEEQMRQGRAYNL